MPNKMLIDATHPEETRVVVVRGNRVEEFDFETAQRKQLRGNIYLAKVTRVEPSLQAAFVEYGGNRHGFLAFSEIHPDYYQIPVADRQALIEAEEQAHREAEEESENRSHGRRRSRHRNARRRGHGERVRSDIVEGLEAGADPAAQPVEGAAQPEHAEGEHLHAATEHHGEHEGHDHGDHDRDHDDHHHDHEHHHAHDDAHGHEDERDHHDHDRAGETPAPVAAVGAEPAVETAAEPQPAPTFDVPASEAHGAEAQAEPLAEAVTSAAEPADAVYAAGESTEAPHAEAAQAGEEQAGEDDDEDEEDGEDAEEEVVESVGGDDVLEEVPERTFRPRRQYKIQEVIKRRQVMLVQVVKEERGNKGAALTTYLSLAGRYAVLMPNTARGGGISRKITSAQDRSRLKEVVQDLDVPEGMGIILRTAGASRTKPEIKRDFEYLIRMWETVRDLTLKSQAPTLVYEEGSLIKRSLRDLYNKEIDEIQVAGEAGYREARDFMKMLMPANVSAVKQYRDGQPLFSRMGVESQLDAMFSPTVQLRSGGYIVINQTEALVSIDVNSGRSTREHHIEDTALKTNLEAAEEVARQLRLRDLAGLIVIDFIDMDEKRNNRAVERKLSDCLRQDRARIQVGRISHFGLLEMSRQRIRASVLESSTDPCPHCGGTGHVRSVSSVALQLLRGLEEILMKGATHNLVVRTRTDVALYVLNHKRGHLRDLENGFKVTLSVIADASVSGPQAYVIDRGEQVHTLEAAKALLAAQAAASPPPLAEEVYDDEDGFDLETESEVETDETEGLADEQAGGEAASEQDGQRRKRRRRRRGRGGQREGELRDDTAPILPEPAMVAAEGEDETESEQDGEEGEEQAARGEQQGSSDRRRRRGRRGGRRRRGGGEEGLAGSISDELGTGQPPEAVDAVADFDGFGGQASPSIAQAEPSTEPQVAQPEPRAEMQTEAPAQQPEPAPATTAATPDEELAGDRAARRRSTVREKVSFLLNSQPEPATPAAEATEPVAAPAPAAEPAPEAASESPTAPRRAGWWSRRFGGGE
ncbi:MULTISPECIES: Rne/Rng family ribonuclease [Bradyrhizobium]|uniref:Rne/Rng family ribonuclease n=1 Tax=Bradyrhizobium TaxID=374 RepID=UPI00155F16B5|nr:ribonuclease E/G [Bradyrhizobium sp. WBAH30]MDD1546509.1 ribonuclease E/G [Bradyrhizobium sp. WBAH41]MDD1560203.1 ribonuclease E/G [Bradyrhizobium sp. WBAH23]MDD1567740.1 ribonuclease E/G [Bradyrhizobium sp. WBAH33]MDD1592417.1 ribonuclease E/G [Bradyrhizobium sp. WBAH42]NRB91176.1 ribonuclease E/G [Bradyrhizobium sp. WBAH10]QCJ91152.1 ribonuclease E/G [Bradyrhizobium yuanmingense]